MGFFIFYFGYLILLLRFFCWSFSLNFLANKKHDLTSPSSKRRESRSYSDFEYDIGPVSSWLVSERQTSNRSGINDQQQSNSVEHGIVPNVSNDSNGNGNNADSDNENFQNTVDPNLISTSRFLGSHGENKSKSLVTF